jgi:nucleolin
MGREIRVELASPRPGGPRKSPGPKGGAGQQNPPSSTVFLGNLPYDVTEDVVREKFKDCGEIGSIRWVTNRETGDFKCCGFVDFDSVEAATKAVEFNETDLGGKNVRVDFAGEKKEGGGGGGRGGGGGFGGGRGGRGGGFAARAPAAEPAGKRITFD